jgi:hypothetical protein
VGLPLERQLRPAPLSVTGLPDLAWRQAAAEAWDSVGRFLQLLELAFAIRRCVSTGTVLPGADIQFLEQVFPATGAFHGLGVALHQLAAGPADGRAAKARRPAVPVGYAEVLLVVSAIHIHACTELGVLRGHRVLHHLATALPAQLDPRVPSSVRAYRDLYQATSPLLFQPPQLNSDGGSARGPSTPTSTHGPAQEPEGGTACLGTNPAPETGRSEPSFHPLGRAVAPPPDAWTSGHWALNPEFLANNYVFFGLATGLKQQLELTPSTVVPPPPVASAQPPLPVTGASTNGPGGRLRVENPVPSDDRFRVLIGSEEVARVKAWCARYLQVLIGAGGAYVDFPTAAAKEPALASRSVTQVFRELPDRLKAALEYPPNRVTQVRVRADYL